MQETATLKIHKEVFPFLNISFFLNNFKPISSLEIENCTDLNSKAVEVSITADLPCIDTFSFLIEDIPANKTIKVPLDKLRINREYVNKISETEKASFFITLKNNDTTVLSDIFTLDLHAIEYFGGFEILPQLIASYVTPNHPYIYHIKRIAAEFLEKNNLRVSFEGYQSDNPERVLELMSAIYSAIQSEDIVYSSLPPGYEVLGQRLRLLNTIQKEKFANCIDLSLLFAACFESIGLNPVLIIVKGHAFIGCWLNDDKFSEIINDDKTAITKRLSKGIREMAAVEATSICKGNNIKFSDALNTGEAQLVQNDDFIISIDIKRARTSMIRPLPLITNTNNTEIAIDEKEEVSSPIYGMEKNFELGTIYQDTLMVKSPTTKLKLWERKLLDLSLRNNLLNLRMTRNTLQLVDIDISHLEDVLSEGKSFSILPNTGAQILRKYNLFLPPLHSSDKLYQIANDELKYNRLCTYYHPEDLDKILSFIHKSAKLSIEENGASTLYLAVGLLKWYDRKTPEQQRFAPVLLLPVEINRRSVNSKFTLKTTGEETMINMTLLEFLRQEYQLNLSGLEQLPYDDKGVDVSKVMGILRRAIMQLKGWDVEEQLVLGNFSFNKLILWKDITANQDKLRNNKLVRSLIDGRLSLGETHKVFNIESILSQNITLPIPTDVSQTEAVLNAQSGNSFILHGPPGTGKSQTITNIIADALYRGKKVLFVAAKKAALDVVHKRLAQIGLAPFTLELHSNKSKKSDVLSQLSNSLETRKSISNIDYTQESLRLDSAKKPLNEYVNILHTKQNIGWSLFESISSIDKFNSYNFPRNFIPNEILQKVNQSKWQKWEDWLPEFITIIELIKHPNENPLSEIKVTTYSSDLNQNLESLSKDILIKQEILENYFQEITDRLKFPFNIKSKNEFDTFVQFTQEIILLPNLPVSLLQYLSNKDNVVTFEEWKSYFGEILSLHNRIAENFGKNIFNLDLVNLEMQWRSVNKSWFIPKWMGKRKIKKQLSVYRNSMINDEEVENLFLRNNQLGNIKKILEQERYRQVEMALKNLFKEDLTDLNEITEKTKEIERLNILNLWDYNGLSLWIQKLTEGDIISTDEIKERNAHLISDFNKSFIDYYKVLEEYESLTGIDCNSKENWIQNAKHIVEGVARNLLQLKNWINYNNICEKGKTLGLQWMILAYENKLFNIKDAKEYFYYSVHASIIQKTISQYESLSLFNKNLFESKIAQYRQIANEYRLLTIQELNLKLASSIPNTTIEAMQSSEIGILQRAIRSKGRGLSIRKLFDQIPTLLPRISPCMLMSPISAAQYFDADSNHFDLVIFDEASQLPTYEAVSALARAKQAVIVGDPKQMPPTSFFNTIKFDEENSDIEDLESILDDCLSLSIPSIYLLRHYRSKHESLIAFSNVNYYESKLLTFPSFDDLNQKVKYHNISGYYDKGKSRTNKFEAEAIVEYIINYYKNEEKRKKSLGIITFSQTQQSLIEEKLNNAFMIDSQLEEFALHGDEPLFIKNLENVQGDERDIVLFSIGYGPDEFGKVSMNFGPLNRNGGWRRLNVAVTRARYEMHVFATLKADQIDLTRTSAEGVAGLKSFLQFAEKGHLSLSYQDVQGDINLHTLSETICEKLNRHGLNVKSNIGTSDFKIDIGVIHPENPDVYILGILLDGNYYYKAKTSNDRELVLPSVLQALGWNIYRIWTIDWLENSSNIIDDIIKLVENLQKNWDKRNEHTQELSTPNVSNVLPVKTSLENYQSKMIITKKKEYTNSNISPELYANSTTIYDFLNREKIKQQVQKIVFTEEPISKNLLYKRILHAWNVSRAGSKLDSYLDEIIKEVNLSKILHYQPFYWINGSNKQIDFYRSNDVEKRNIEDIAPEELTVAITEAVEQNLSIEQEELLRYIAKIFGFSKVGRQIDEVLNYCVDISVKTGKIKREGSRLKVI